MEKNYLFILLLAVFAVSIVSAGECSMNGYDYCYQTSDSYGDASSTSKVYWSFEDDAGRLGYGVAGGSEHPTYAVGGLYYKAGFEGDSIYIFKNSLSSWNSLNCDEYGCYGLSPTSLSKVKIANVGQEFKDCIGFVSWDKDTASNGDWVWTTAGSGWTGSSNCLSIKVVNCFDDSDCSGDDFCKKVGDWKTWKCEMSPQPMTFFRLENNNCNPVFILESEKTSNDYTTSALCEEKIETSVEDPVDNPIDDIVETEQTTNYFYFLIPITLLILIILFLWRKYGK